jgi:hypothetical protein
MIICILLLLANGLIFVPDDVDDSQKIAGGAIMLIVLIVMIVVCLGIGVRKVLSEYRRGIFSMSSSTAGAGKANAMTVSSVIDTSTQVQNVVTKPFSVSSMPDTPDQVTKSGPSIETVQLLAKQLRDMHGSGQVIAALTPEKRFQSRSTGIQFS